MNNPFIHPENQQRIWNTIHKIPHINQSFSSQLEKEIWFKHIIELFHENYSSTPIKELNRATIAYMVKDIHDRQTSVGQTPNPSINGENELIKRQREYEQMSKPIQPPEVTFEKIEDTVITNMDELIKQYTNQRGDEIPSPPSNMIIQDILKRLEKIEEKVFSTTTI
jgi:hypothetical protein